MAKPRAKQKTEYQTSMTRSVFLYGKPNKGKYETLRHIQDVYADLANQYITALTANDDYAMQLVKNDKKDSSVRKLEKSIRLKNVNSAFCQNAFDCAFTKLSNRLNAIRLDMYARAQSLFTQSKVLFAMCVMQKPQADMVQMMEDLKAAAGRQDRIDFYAKCADTIRGMKADAFAFEQKVFMDSYQSECLMYAVPHITREQVSLDSRLMRIEEATNIQAQYVIAITDPFTKGSRIVVPLTTSGNGLRRIKQYGMAGTVHYSVWTNGKIRVQASFNKHVEQPKTNKYIGVDTGIKDCFYCSDGRSIGSMDEVLRYYQTVVEPAFADLSDLRNKKTKILHYLHTHPSIPADVRAKLLQKVDLLEHMIRTANAPYRKKRGYYQRLSHEVADSVRKYVEHVDQNTVTVIERLDIREFHKSRKVNGMLSTFARGQLQQKLMDELNWHGKTFVEVEPDYSSQTCPVCGHIDAASRNGKTFRCTQCGHTDDADHNAAVNLKNRATDQEFLDICERYKYDHDALQKAIRQLGEQRSAAWKKEHGPVHMRPAV